MAHRPFAVVAGAGPGLGQALMRRFIANGMTVVGLSRSGATDSDLDIRACDLTDANAVRSVISGLISAYGTPKIVVHNPAHLVIRPFLELTESDFIDCWRAMTLSAVLLGQSTLQPMVRGGGGSFLVSGATASLRGGANFAAFTAAKFALRGLTQSFARGFQPPASMSLILFRTYCRHRPKPCLAQDGPLKDDVTRRYRRNLLADCKSTPISLVA